jgi:phage terminase large subunit GpA-like protein
MRRNGLTLPSTGRLYAKGEAPDGIVHVVVTVDVQKNSLYYVARGWGPRATSYLLDWGQLYGEVIHDEVWSALADYITNTVCGFPVRLVLIDSGFRPGKKDEIPQNKVYDFVRRFRGDKVFATKGSSHTMQKPLRVSKQEITSKGKALRYGINLLILDSGYWKSWVHERLHWEKGQLGDWYLPQDVDDEYMKQIISESKTRLSSGKVIWVEHSSKNHFLDCEALQAAAAHLLNVARIPPLADVMQRRPPFDVTKKPSAPPAKTPPAQPPTVIPEAPIEQLLAPVEEVVDEATARAREYVQKMMPQRPPQWLQPQRESWFKRK